MDKEFIDYTKLVDDAMHLIVYEALQIVSSRGLLGEHHFFISFITTHPGVKISEFLMRKYPNTMTIIIRNQYRNLQVGRHGFRVNLIFNGVEQTLYIPYSAIMTFADPSVEFGLQFRHYDAEEDYIVEVIEKAKQNKSKKSRDSNNTSNINKSNIISFDDIKKNKALLNKYR